MIVLHGLSVERKVRAFAQSRRGTREGTGPDAITRRTVADRACSSGKAWEAVTIFALDEAACLTSRPLRRQIFIALLLHGIGAEDAI